MAYVVAKVKYREEEREQGKKIEWRVEKKGSISREIGRESWGVEKAKDRVRKGKIEWERERGRERKRKRKGAKQSSKESCFMRMKLKKSESRFVFRRKIQK